MKGKLTTLVLAICLCFPALAQSEKSCLASAIHYESRGESLKGQRAILDVVLSRSRTSGKSLCQVVKAKGQFSFVSKQTKWLSEGASDMIIWRTFEAESVVGDAEYFTHKRLRPKWTKKLIKVKTIGAHVFYRDI